jgi:hypothetical protein
MTLFCRGVEWYDISRSHLSLSSTFGGSADSFSSYTEAKKADGGILDIDVLSPNRPETELASQDTPMAASFDADFTDCVYTSGFVTT